VNSKSYLANKREERDGQGWKNEEMKIEINPGQKLLRRGAGE